MASILVACVLAALCGRFLRNHGCLSFMVALFVLPTLALLIDGGMGLSSVAIVFYAGVMAYYWPQVQGLWRKWGVRWR